MTHDHTPCLICSGSKTIRLPVRRPVSAVRNVEPPTISIDDCVRTYPCPECTQVQDHRLHIACAAGSAPSDDLERRPDARAMVQRTATHNLVDYMLWHDLVQFTEQPDPSGWRDRTKIVAKMAVVDPSRITSLEQRVKEATAPAIADAADRAISKISVWGSYYGRDTVTKEEAIRFIREAVREAQNPASNLGSLLPK